MKLTILRKAGHKQNRGYGQDYAAKEALNSTAPKAGQYIYQSGRHRGKEGQNTSGLNAKAGT